MDIIQIDLFDGGSDMMFGIIIIGLLIYGIYLLNNKNNSKQGRGSSDHSVYILRERLARGEINEEEYERLRRVLREEEETSF